MNIDVLNDTRSNKMLHPHSIRFRAALGAGILLLSFAPGSASGVILTNADATYSVLGKNVVVQQNMTFNGRIGIVSGGLLNLSNNTIHGRVDYSGAVNHTVSGAWSITGGEIPNFGVV